MARLLQPPASAICEEVSSSLLIISRINTRVDFARLGAMVPDTACTNQETQMGTGKLEVGHMSLQFLVLQVINISPADI
jgi:hypothetical protein